MQRAARCLLDLADQLRASVQSDFSNSSDTGLAFQSLFDYVNGPCKQAVAYELYDLIHRFGETFGTPPIRIHSEIQILSAPDKVNIHVPSHFELLKLLSAWLDNTDPEGTQTDALKAFQEFGSAILGDQSFSIFKVHTWEGDEFVTRDGCGHGCTKRTGLKFSDNWIVEPSFVKPRKICELLSETAEWLGSQSTAADQHLSKLCERTSRALGQDPSDEKALNKLRIILLGLTLHASSDKLIYLERFEELGYCFQSANPDDQDRSVPTTLRIAPLASELEFWPQHTFENHYEFRAPKRTGEPIVLPAITWLLAAEADWQSRPIVRVLYRLSHRVHSLIDTDDQLKNLVQAVFQDPSLDQEHCMDIIAHCSQYCFAHNPDQLSSKDPSSVKVAEEGMSKFRDYRILGSRLLACLKDELQVDPVPNLNSDLQPANFLNHLPYLKVNYLPGEHPTIELRRLGTKAKPARLEITLPADALRWLNFPKTVLKQVPAVEKYAKRLQFHYLFEESRPDTDELRRELLAWLSQSDGERYFNLELAPLLGQAYGLEADSSITQDEDNQRFKVYVLSLLRELDCLDLKPVFISDRARPQLRLEELDIHAGWPESIKLVDMPDLNCGEVHFEESSLKEAIRAKSLWFTTDVSRAVATVAIGKVNDEHQVLRHAQFLFNIRQRLPEPQRLFVSRLMTLTAKFLWSTGFEDCLKVPDNKAQVEYFLNEARAFADFLLDSRNPFSTGERSALFDAMEQWLLPNKGLTFVPDIWSPGVILNKDTVDNFEASSFDFNADYPAGSILLKKFGMKSAKKSIKEPQFDLIVAPPPDSYSAID